MSDYKERAEATEALITQINWMKLRLEVKHGPSVKKLWAERKRYDPAYELAIKA